MGVFPQTQSKAYDLMLSTLLSHTVNEIYVEDINETDTNLIFLDAREKKEFEVSHIKNTYWVGYNDFNFKRINHLPKDKKIIVYCSVGYRSEKIAERLKKKGFKNVYNLYGGIFEWVNQGKPVYDASGKVTQNIHAYDYTWGIWLSKGNKIYD
ncbi:MAG: hypothetical protein Kow0079_09750 [Vicingaceae bacterium]